MVRTKFSRKGELEPVVRRMALRGLGVLLLAPTLLVMDTLPSLSLRVLPGEREGQVDSPVWKVDLRAAGYPVQPGSGEPVTDFSFSPLCFVDRRALVVSFVARQTSGSLQRRNGPDQASPIQLTAKVFDATHGNRTATLNWGVEHPYGAVVCGPDTFVAATLDRLRLYSMALKQIAELSIPPASHPGWVPWALHVSPTGRSLLLVYYEPLFSASNRTSAKEKYLETTKEDYQWIDATTLHTQRTWTEDILQFFSISDTRIVKIVRLSTSGGDAVMLRTIDGPWQRAGQSEHDGKPRFVSNDVLALIRGHGISLIHTNGRELFNAEFRHDEWISVGRATQLAHSADAQRIAVTTWVLKGGSKILDIPGHRELKSILVLDTPSRRWVYALDAPKEGIKSISGLALSPDGTLMALINQDGVLELFRLPPVDTSTQVATPANKSSGTIHSP